MTDLDRPRFAAALTGLAEILDAALSPTRFEGYFVALEDLSLESVEAAIARAVRECRFFPKPVELREFVGGSVDDAAELAWGSLVHAARVGYWDSVTFEDPLVVPVIRQVFGGWPECVDAHCDLPEPAWQGKRKEWLALYRAGRRGGRPPEGRQYLAGMAEIRNRETVPMWDHGFEGLQEQRVLSFGPAGAPRALVHPEPLALPAPTEQDPPALPPAA